MTLVDSVLFGLVTLPCGTRGASQANWFSGAVSDRSLSKPTLEALYTLGTAFGRGPCQQQILGGHS